MRMEPESFWHLVLNSPEWVAVFANGLFAVVTIGVVTWQVYVMKAQVRVMTWQGRNSHRNEQIQNRLLRLQHEHEWLLQKNQEREEILKSARKLHLSASSLKPTPSRGDPENWFRVQDTVYELDSRLNILDIAVFMGVNDNWYPNLRGYVNAVLKAVLNDSNYPQPDSSGFPAPETLKALADADEGYDPIKIFLDLETAIRMEFFDFKTKWDASLS